MSEYMEHSRRRGVAAPYKPGQLAPSEKQLRALLSTKRKYQYLYQMPIEELTDKVVDYFKSVTEESIDNSTGEVLVKYKQAPTAYGLALAVGSDRDTIMRYSNGEYEVGSGKAAYGVQALEHCALLKKSLEQIRDYYERNLTEAMNPAGTCFWLKNSAGWRDEQTVVVRPENPLGQVQSPDELAKLTLPPADDEE